MGRRHTVGKRRADSTKPAFDPLIQNHYDNTPLQYTANFHGFKNNNVQLKTFNHFHIFA